MNRSLLVFFLGALVSAQLSIAAPVVRHHKDLQQTVMPVDVNLASAAELSVLKGIGLKKAQRIVAYRKAHGNFKKLDDLTAVQGIGAKSLVRLEKQNPGKLMVNSPQKLR